MPRLVALLAALLVCPVIAPVSSGANAGDFQLTDILTSRQQVLDIDSDGRALRGIRDEVEKVATAIRDGGGCAQWPPR